MQLKRIPGYSDYYASDRGDIVSFKYKLPRILKKLLTKDGYFYVCLSNYSGTKNLLVNKLVCSAWHGLPKKGMQAAHIDHNPLNNKPSNLWWRTPKENTEDKKDNGTHPSQLIHSLGRKNGRSKLTESDVIEIRDLYAKGGYTHKDLARLYGVTTTPIEKLLNRETWKHVP